MTFTQLRDPETGWILDTESQERTERGVILDNGVERAIVAINTFQLICLTITRISAYLMYPGTCIKNFIRKKRSYPKIVTHFPVLYLD